MMRWTWLLVVTVTTTLALPWVEAGAVDPVFSKMGTQKVIAAMEAGGNPALSQASQDTKASDSNKGSSSKKSPKRQSFLENLNLRISGSLVLQSIYDDNILRYSDGFIEDFRRNDPPDKFHVETYDDAILSPRVFLTFRANPFGKRETRLYLGYITWQYMQNPSKDNDLWSLRLRQYVARYDRFEFSYSYSPLSYVRHLSDREAYEPRSTTPLEWKPFKSVRHGLGLSFTHRFRRGLYATIEGGRVLRFYNRPFMENDNWEWNGSVEILWNPPGVWRFIGRYMYSDSNARGLDTVEETIETSDNGDGSYERDLYELRARLRPKGGLWMIREFELKGQFMGYFFTGTKPPHEDRLHTGRKDDVYYLELTAGSKRLMGGPITLKLGYRYAQRTSSLPATVEAEDAEDKDYTNNRAWLEVRYSL